MYTKRLYLCKECNKTWHILLDQSELNQKVICSSCNKHLKEFKEESKLVVPEVKRKVKSDAPVMRFYPVMNKKGIQS